MTQDELDQVKELCDSLSFLLLPAMVGDKPARAWRALVATRALLARPPEVARPRLQYSTEITPDDTTFTPSAPPAAPAGRETGQAQEADDLRRKLAVAERVAASAAEAGAKTMHDLLALEAHVKVLEVERDQAKDSERRARNALETIREARRRELGEKA